MTTATLVVGNRTMETAAGPRRKTLEELIEGLMDALTFKEETETAEPGAARSIHEARRLKQAGDVDGAPERSSQSVDTARAETNQARWAFAEWKQVVKQRYGDRSPVIYSQSTGKASALVPSKGGGTFEVVAVLGMRWRPGKVVSERSLRGLRPLSVEVRDGRRQRDG